MLFIQRGKIYLLDLNQNQINSVKYLFKYQLKISKLIDIYKKLQKKIENYIQLMDDNNFMFALGGILLFAFIIYFIFIRKPSKPSHIQTSTVRRNRQALGNDECSICLSQQKKFQTSVTCGHSFCGKCLMSLYNHSNQKIKCPLCRNQVNVIFKVWHNQQPKEQGSKIQQQIRQYNHKFNDDRSFFRKLNEFPFVLRAASDRLWSIQFIKYFFSTASLVKMGVTILLYLISPLDLLPEMLLGPAGYLDDFGFLIIVLLYTVSNSVIQYVRNRQ